VTFIIDCNQKNGRGLVFDKDSTKAPSLHPHKIKKVHLPCRKMRCPIDIWCDIIPLQQGTFSGSPALGLPIADALREKPKRARSLFGHMPIPPLSFPSLYQQHINIKPLSPLNVNHPHRVNKRPEKPLHSLHPSKTAPKNSLLTFNLDPTTSVSEIGPLLIRALQLLLSNNASTPAAVPTPSTSSVAQPTKTPTKPSWSEILKRHKPEERKKVNEELNKLNINHLFHTRIRLRRFLCSDR